MGNKTMYRAGMALPAALLVGILLGGMPIANAQEASDSRLAGSPPDAGRGRILYDLGCKSCHGANAHWRDKHIVHSWQSLREEVKRWERIAGRHWQAAEIEDVAAYLNERFYHLPCPAEECLDRRAQQRDQETGK